MTSVDLKLARQFPKTNPPKMRLFSPRAGLDDTNSLMVFIHVPKCGGTTAHAMFRKLFRRNYINVHQQLISSGLKRKLAELSPIQAIGGHFALDRNPALRFLEDRKTENFALVREPITRFISHYRYFCRSPKSVLVQRNPAVANYSLEDFVHSMAEEQRVIDFNIQTKMLTGQSVFNSRAQDILVNRFMAAVPSEFSDVAFEVLAENLGVSSPEKLRMNESPGEPIFSVSKYALEYICSVSSEDIKLHNFVRQWFAQSLSESCLQSSLPARSIRYFGQGEQIFKNVVDTTMKSIEARKKTLLCRLMSKQSSDKCSARHNYTLLYDGLFSSKRNEISAVFEMGLGTNNPELPANMGISGVPGASLRAWARYFPNAAVVGADIDRTTLFSNERISTFYADQMDPAALVDMWKQCKQPYFDLMIDDGLHRFEAALNTFHAGYARLRPGGYYVIEDIWLSKENIQKYETFLTEETVDAALIHLPLPGNTRDNAMIIIRKPEVA